MLTKLSTSPKVVGAKQVKRSIEAGKAQLVFLAEDADPRLTQSIADLCGEKGVPTQTVGSMKELGHACGIAVGSAVAALIGE